MRGDHVRSMSKAALAVCFSFALVASGCGSDDEAAEEGDGQDVVGGEETTGESSEDAPTDSSDETTEGDDDTAGEGADGSFPAECPDAGSFEGTIERSADDEAGHRAVTLDGSEITDVIASEFMGLYGVYLADHEVDRSVLDEALAGSISSENNLEAPEGSVLVTIGIGDLYADAPTATGDIMSTEDSSLTLMVDSGGGSLMFGVEEEGTAEVLGLTDESICFTIEFQADSRSVDGIVHAHVYDGTN